MLVAILYDYLSVFVVALDPFRIASSDPWCQKSSLLHRSIVEVPLDRWIYTSSRQKPFTNYVSFGVDAAIAHRFHRLRLHYPFLCRHPFVNILLYAWCIVMELLFPTLHSLSHLHVTVDSEEIPVAGFHSVLFLNIPYFCGGGLPLGRTIDPLQSCDQQIEIIGFHSIFHLLAMKVGVCGKSHLVWAA